jgi:uncharacterized protein (DUF302 family)
MHIQKTSNRIMRKIRNFSGATFIATVMIAVLLGGVPRTGWTEDDPAIWKMRVEDNYAALLEDVKTGLEAAQFSILSESNLAGALAMNRDVLGNDQWNTIGFDEARAVTFCSLVFNKEVLNLDMDYSILCPFKIVLYSMKSEPEVVTILMVRPTYLLAHHKDPGAKAIGQKIEERIVKAITAAVHR